MKTMHTLAIAAMAGLVALAAPAAAGDGDGRSYTCRAGAVVITSASPCYVTTYGISVPGSHDVKEKAGKASGQNGSGGGKKGGGFKDGPKDLKDKPKGGGFGGGGPKGIKS